MIYNMFFYDKLPLGYDPDAIATNEAEELALATMKNALSDHPGCMTPDQATQALTTAYKKGFLPALYWCGWLYQYQPYIFLRTWYYGRTGCAFMHYRKAEHFYLKAIHAGDMNAHYGLATLYIFGNYDHSDHYVDGFPGIHLSKGFYHMHQAALNGVKKAMKGLSFFFKNQIYNSEIEIQNYLYAIQVNKYRDQSGLRYGTNNELIFDPDALGLINLECIDNKELSQFWSQQANYSHCQESARIIELMNQAMAHLKEYEKEYLHKKTSLLTYDRKHYKQLRKDDNELKWKKQMDDEMHQRIESLPVDAHPSEKNAIYDEYAEKRKWFYENKRGYNMNNAIGITVIKATNQDDLGASKFFGAPVIPSKWENIFAEDELFLCQIRLSEISELDIDDKLPHTGYLYIFLHMDSYPYQPHILYYDGEPDMVIDDFNDAFDEYINGDDAWLMNFAEVEDDAEGIKLFGIPANWDNEDEAPRLLLQYDPLASDMSFANHIDGFIYFFYPDDSEKLENIIYVEERS